MLKTKIRHKKIKKVLFQKKKFLDIERSTLEA